MKKKLCATFLTLLALMVFATSVFAAEARWRNVTKITPIILASTNTYTSIFCILQSIINGCLLGLPEFLHEKSGSLVLYQQTAIKDLESLF